MVLIIQFLLTKSQFKKLKLNWKLPYRYTLDKNKLRLGSPEIIKNLIYVI